MKSKVCLLPTLVYRTRSFNRFNFYKVIEVNKNEKILSHFIEKDTTLNWFIGKFSVNKTTSRTNLTN